MNVLERAMDINWLRQQLIANNIANANAPHYKRQDIDFRKTLERAVESGVTGSAGLDPVFIDTEFYSIFNNENNVDMENEMSQQTINLLQYNTLTRLEADQLAMLKTAILGRG